MTSMVFEKWRKKLKLPNIKINKLKKAATILQVYYKYHFKKKQAKNSKVKCHKASQVELDLLLPSGMFQNLNGFLKVFYFLIWSEFFFFEGSEEYLE